MSSDQPLRLIGRVCGTCHGTGYDLDRTRANTWDIGDWARGEPLKPCRACGGKPASHAEMAPAG